MYVYFVYGVAQNPIYIYPSNKHNISPSNIRFNMPMPNANYVEHIGLA